MNNVDIQFISSGFRKILYTDGVKDLVSSTAERIRDEANEGVTNSRGFGRYVKGGYYGGGRWVGFVYAKDQVANAAQTEHQVLTRALHT